MVALGTIYSNYICSMTIVQRFTKGKLKGYTIRKSKNGKFDLYSCNGISQTTGKNTLNDIYNIIEQFNK
jgi:hypothetical protein